MTAPASDRMTRVVVDAMGGDHGPSVVVRGCVEACGSLPVEVELVGREELIRPELAAAGARAEAIRVLNAPDVVSMGEKLNRATLRKRSSIQVGLERVREGQADAFFSAGNTAACWTIAKIMLGTLEEVDRPALAAVMPNRVSHSVLIDAGANTACKARNLEEFAVMGSVYSRCVLHTANPRVGLMSVGEEETKGNDLTKEVNEVLKSSSLNFIGNVEGNDLFTGKVDVVVVDGFTGNVVLKASEALAESIMYLIKEEIGGSPPRKLGAWLARGALRAVRKRTDAAEYGGAPLLGVRGCCVVGHGRSEANAIRHGIRAAAEFFSSGVNAQVEAELRNLRARDGVAAELA